MSKIANEVLEKMSGKSFDFSPESRAKFTTGGMKHISEFLKTAPVTLHFGQYKGKTIEEIAKEDRPYLRWLRRMVYSQPETDYYLKVRQAIDKYDEKYGN